MAKNDMEAHDALVRRIGVYVDAGVMARRICDAAGLADTGLASRVLRGTVIAGPRTIERLHIGMDRIADRLMSTKGERI